MKTKEDEVRTGKREGCRIEGIKIRFLPSKQPAIDFHGVWRWRTNTHTREVSTVFIASLVVAALAIANRHYNRAPSSFLTNSKKHLKELNDELWLGLFKMTVVSQHLSDVVFPLVMCYSDTTRIIRCNLCRKRNSPTMRKIRLNVHFVYLRNTFIWETLFTLAAKLERCF